MFCEYSMQSINISELYSNNNNNINNEFKHIGKEGLTDRTKR